MVPFDRTLVPVGEPVVLDSGHGSSASCCEGETELRMESEMDGDGAWLPGG